MNSLAELLGGVPDRKEQVDPFFARFGFRQNPFPAARTVIEEVLYNQIEARDRFVALVREVLAAEPQRRAMAVVGGTGGGKTHFLRHCQYLMKEFRKTSSKPFVVVEVLAGSTSATYLIREILREADETAKLSREYDLLTAIVRSSESEADFNAIKQVELRNVLQLLFRATRTGFSPPDRDGRMSFEPLRDLAKKWLAGASLSNTEKRHLGVFSRLTSAAMMVRFMSELLALARAKQILDGVMLCLDEVETLFSGSSSSSKIQGYLQDLRYLFDEALRGTEGYSLLVLSASTGQGTLNLRTYNYPLFQRLGFEEGSRADLQAIADSSEVKGLADVYVEYELKRANLNRAKVEDILTDAELDEAYKTAATADRNAPSTLVRRVNQGQLLQALHQIVERKRAASEARERT